MVILLKNEISYPYIFWGEAQGKLVYMDLMTLLVKHEAMFIASYARFLSSGAENIP